MANLELGEQHLRNIVDQVINDQPKLRQRRRITSERRRNYQGFIEKASELVESYGEDQESNRARSLVRLTRPVEMEVGEERIQIQVARFTYSYSQTYHRDRLAIAVSVPARDMSNIFEIDQTHVKPVGMAERVLGRQARNQWNKIATDAEVAGALQSLLWLERQLQ